MIRDLWKLPIPSTLFKFGGYGFHIEVNMVIKNKMTFEHFRELPQIAQLLRWGWGWGGSSADLT
jgi:hypothetical protein